MFKLFVVVCAIASLVQSAPQISEIELKDQAFNRINEAEYDYKFSLSDGHEQEQSRRDVDGVQVVIGFYKYVDPDGKSRQIYYKADKKGFQVSYNKPFELPGQSERLTELSNSYLPPRENLIRDVLTDPSKSYLPPSVPSKTYLPHN
ncbi:unnamed protein product [Diamesa tonsa]